VQGDSCIGNNSAGGIDNRTRDGTLSRALRSGNNREQAETQQAHREHREALTDQLNKHEEALLRLRRVEYTRKNLCAGTRLAWQMCKSSEDIPVSRPSGNQLGANPHGDNFDGGYIDIAIKDIERKSNESAQIH
jgi:hypothetical protein